MGREGCWARTAKSLSVRSITGWNIRLKRLLFSAGKSPVNLTAWQTWVAPFAHAKAYCISMTSNHGTPSRQPSPLGGWLVVRRPGKAQDFSGLSLKITRMA